MLDASASMAMPEIHWHRTTHHAAGPTTGDRVVPCSWGKPLNLVPCRWRMTAGKKAKLKGLIAGCGGQAFEHLSAACPPEPAPWCGSPGAADWYRVASCVGAGVACARRLGWAAITG